MGKFVIKTDDKSGQEFISLDGFTKSVMMMPILEDGSIVLIEKYMPSLGKPTLVFPGGRFEKHESDLNLVAERELLEETGLVFKDLIKIGCVNILPKYFLGETYYGIAKDCKFFKKFTDVNEVDKVVTLTSDEINKKIENGEICDVRTICLFYWAKKYV